MCVWSDDLERVKQLINNGVYKMANAKKIVVSNKEDQIKTINKVNFDNITPIIKADKTLNKLTVEEMISIPKGMLKADPRFSNDLVDQIRGSENEISGLKTTNSENTKLVCYDHFPHQLPHLYPEFLCLCVSHHHQAAFHPPVQLQVRIL